MSKIEEENRLLEPVYYLEVKAKLEEKLELLKNKTLKNAFRFIQISQTCYNIFMTNIFKGAKSDEDTHSR